MDILHFEASIGRFFVILELLLPMSNFQAGVQNELTNFKFEDLREAKIAFTTEGLPIHKEFVSGVYGLHHV